MVGPFWQLWNWLLWDIHQFYLWLTVHKLHIICFLVPHFVGFLQSAISSQVLPLTNLFWVYWRMADGISSFWGPVTYTHKWCEPNYVYSSYIAEFFNPMSNVPGIILALIGLVNSLRQHFEKRFSILHISNMILSIGSILYHATLQRL